MGAQRERQLGLGQKLSPAPLLEAGSTAACQSRWSFPSGGGAGSSGLMLAQVCTYLLSFICSFSAQSLPWIGSQDIVEPNLLQI